MSDQENANASLQDHIDSLCDKLVFRHEKQEPAISDWCCLRESSVRQALQDFVTNKERIAYAQGEKAGRSDELVKIVDWGKTVDDQWNQHFELRLAELTKESTDG